MKKTLFVGLVAGLFVFGMVDKVTAELQSSNSSTFGDDTITVDTETGLSWLDLTCTTQYSKSEMLDALDNNPSYSGFRMATGEEVYTFLSHAGIDTTLGLYAPANYTPIRNLMEFIGITGYDGNPGIVDASGNPVHTVYSYGHVLEEHSEGSTDMVGVVVIDDYAVATGDPDRGETGWVTGGWVPNDNHNDRHGSWLVMVDPTPEEATQDIITDVVDLVSNTPELTESDGNKLVNVLDDAYSLIVKGNQTAAIDKLENFIGKVERLVSKEDISKEEGEALIAAANKIIAQLLNP